MELFTVGWGCGFLLAGAAVFTFFLLADLSRLERVLAQILQSIWSVGLSVTIIVSHEWRPESDIAQEIAFTNALWDGMPNNGRLRKSRQIEIRNWVNHNSFGKLLQI